MKMSIGEKRSLHTRCNDQTLIADSLLASNPTEAAKQDIASKGLHKIYHRKTENTNSDDENDVLESDTTPDSAGTTGSIVSREQLPDRFDGNISQNSENANQEEE